MPHPPDPAPLRGLARSLDDLFARTEAPLEGPEPLERAAGAAGRGSARDEIGPTFADPEAALEILEGPLLDADVLVDEIVGAGASSAAVDPEEERRVRVATAAASLAQAVDAFTRGDGEDPIGLSRRIRDEAMNLREENALDPLADAVERLVLAGAPADSGDAPLSLARLLATPAVAARIAQRLAAAREDRRREELTEACRRLGEEAAIAVATALADAEDRAARRNLVSALAALGEHGMSRAEAMVESQSWWTVRNGVAILGEVGGERSVQHLVGTLAHDEPRVRREAVAALARIGGEGAALLIVGRLEDADAGVRATAARAAGGLDSTRVVKTLLGRLDAEESEDVVEEILRSLGQLGDPGAVPAIEKRAVGSFFSRPPTPVRIAAYRALAAIGTPHARGLIEAAAEDRDLEVRTVARSLAGRG